MPMDEWSTEYNRERTIAAWHSFIETGQVAAGSLRRPIYDSWVRCREAGVDPFGVSYPHMSRRELKNKQSIYKDLLACAVPCIRLMHSVAGSGYISISSPDCFSYYLLSDSESDPMSYGVYMREETCGNTAVSVASYEKTTVCLHKYEKYRLVDQDGSGVATPIYDKREIVGYLSINSTGGLAIPFMAALAEQSSAMISALAAGADREKTVALISDLIALGHRAILVIDQTGSIIAANNDCRRFIKTRHADGSPAKIGESLLNKGDIACFLLDPEGSEKTTCSLKTIYSSVFNCQIISKDRITFPDKSSYIVVTLGISPPGIQAKSGVQSLLPSLPTRSENVEYVGESMAWSKIDRIVNKIARFPSNVLLQGESGTGKEVVARTIHNLSGRTGNFVAINCGDIPEGLLQSELYGYEKGSFTGANREGSIGKFEYADHGTVFLDEIGDMPIQMQVSLLRFIQERAVQRIGSNKLKIVDVRLIAATNKDIEQMVKDQLFRNDLYYRLNIIGLTLPPLRERKEDIPLLAQHFFKTISRQYGLPMPEVDEDIYRVLMRHNWPGNVRELRNVCEKLLIMSDRNRITVKTVYTYVLDYDSFNSASDVSLFPESEKEQTSAALLANNWNITKTAASLGITRDTLYRRIKKYGITKR